METCRNVEKVPLFLGKGVFAEASRLRSTNMATLNLKNIVKTYPGATEPTVHDFNLDIADKEFIVLVGPSGCGKSTTLRMIAGLEEITSGELYIGDTLMNNVEPKDRDIAMVFQSYALYPHMTVYDNMAFALKLRHMSKEDIDKRVRWAAEVLDITSYLDRKPRALSGGQRQRVAIGRAIVREPKVFLMDEPLSNLDAKLRNAMRAEIIKLRQRVDTTFIYVTHDQTEAMTLGDRIVIMKDGWVMQIGTPQEVFEHPANMFVAGFIGMPQMNFFQSELVRDANGYHVECNGAKMALSARLQKALAEKGYESRSVVLGCRPEHMIMKKTAGTDTMVAKVDVSEMMGSEIHLHLTCCDKDVVVRIPTTELEESQRGGLTLGTEIDITFPEDLIHLFDPETEENLL